MTAQIHIDDTVGSATGSLISALGRTATFSNFDDAGVLGWFWELLDKPAGSSATLSGSTTDTVDLTPDIEGTYLVQLKTYADAARTSFDDSDVQAIAIEFTGAFPHRIPAAGETSQFSATRGWAEDVNEILRDVHAFMASGATLQGAINEEITTIGSEVVLGGFVFNGGRVGTLAPSLEAVGVLTVAGAGDGYVRLYDMGAPGTPAAPVLRSEVEFANAGAGSVRQALQALTVDAAPGVDADEIFDEDRIYELRAIIVGGAGGDELKVHSAGLRFS